MTVDTPKGSVEFAISPLKATIKPLEMNEQTTSLMDSYFKCGGGGYDEKLSVDIHHFLAWLLSKADVDTLEILKYNGETRQYSWVVDAIVASKARCHNLVMDSKFRFVRMDVKANGNFVEKLAEGQQLLKKKMELRIMYSFVLFHYLHGFDEITKYSSMFSRMVVEFAYQDVVHLIYRAIQQWQNGDLQEQQFILRLSNMTCCEKITLSSVYWDNLLKLNVVLVNITEDELINLPNVVSISPPSHIDFCNSADGKVLRFKFDRKDNVTQINLDFSPC